MELELSVALSTRSAENGYMIKNNTNTTTEATNVKPKYKYLTSQRVNSTIKKHGLQIQYIKGEGYFYFTDLKTGDQVGDSIMVARLHHLSIQQWRDAAAAARGSVAEGYAEAEAAHKAVIKTDASKIRELIASLDKPPVETWDDAVEAAQEDLVEAQA
jgi:hypothetical protein